MSIEQSGQQNALEQTVHEPLPDFVSSVASTIVTPVDALSSDHLLLRSIEGLNATLEVDRLLDRVVQEALILTDACGGCAGVCTSQGMVCHKYILRDAMLPFDYCWSSGEGWPGWLLEHKVPYLTNDALADAQSIHELCLKFDVHEALSIPMMDAYGDVLGFFEVHNKRGNVGFSTSDQQMLQVLARFAALALNNARTFQQLQEANNLLQVKHHQAEEAQRLLAAIVTSSDDAIISKTLGGIITSWNDAAVRVFGYTAEEAIGQPITLIIPPELHTEEKEIIAKVRSGRRIEQYETIRMTKKGNRIDVLLSISPVKDPWGKIIGAAKIAQDITERKRLEAKYRRLFDSNLIGVFVSDFAGAFLDANDAFLGLLGYSREELLTGTLMRDTLTPPEMHWLSQNAIQALYGGGSSGTYEKEYLHKSGRRIPVLVAVTRIEHTETCIGFVLDITERKRAEEQARAARDQLEVILQGVADAIFVYDKSGKIIYANEAAAHLLSYESVEDLLKGLPLSSANKYEIIDERGQPLPNAQLTHKRVLAGEVEAQNVLGYKRKGGQQAERWSFVKSRPVYDERKEVLYVITIVHDVTERVQTEHRKDEFISMASHELKTPVTSLKGFTHVLQRRLRMQNDQQSLYYLSRMDTQLDKLAKLISDLLDISRMQTGKMELHLALVDLDLFIAETVENTQFATSTHQLSIEGETHARILADKDRLGQVFVNLIMNAIKYSPGADCVIVQIVREQERAIVHVKDFGIGIDEIHQQRIFERFYQVTDPEEKTYPGLGIGLYISKDIVERHGGRIEVSSHKGEGSTFSILLPLLREEK